MSNLAAFAAYAADFEKTLLDDNWARLEQYFSTDASYLPGDGTQANGREAAIAALQDSVNALERKSDERALLGQPDISEAGDTITLGYKVKYTKAGVGEFVLAGTETIRYAGGVIARMEDVFEDPDGLMAWRDKIGG